MPYFKVMLHGTGVLFHLTEDAPAAIGFYTTRAVKAESAEEAVEKAKHMVRVLWTTEEYVTANKGGAPKLETDQVERISFWQRLRIPNAGHTFYVSD